MSGQYDANLANGAARNFSVRGSLVKVLSAPGGAVQIKVDGGETYTCLEGQGFFCEPGKLFRDVACKNVSGQAQVVSLFIGDSRWLDSRITGRVSMYENINASCQVQAAGDTAITAITATALLAAAANVAGVTIRGVSTEAKAGAPGSGTTARLVASPTAPAATNPTATQSILLCTIADSDASYKVQSVFNMNRRIPPGWGIWYMRATSTTIAAANGVSVSFEVE